MVQCINFLNTVKKPVTSLENRSLQLTSEYLRLTKLYLI
jgi:hypothetical protein